MKKLTDSYILNNGVAIPCVGFGTWQTPDGETAVNSVKAALAAGYRHIDTAAGYGNEDSVGEGMRASGVAREDIFLTTKHWIMDRGYTKTLAAIDASLKALGTDYIDLYLVHWPCVEKSHPNWKEINAATWRGFAQAQAHSSTLSSLWALSLMTSTSSGRGWTIGRTWTGRSGLPSMPISKPTAQAAGWSVPARGAANPCIASPSRRRTASCSGRNPRAFRRKCWNSPPIACASLPGTAYAVSTFPPPQA